MVSYKVKPSKTVILMSTEITSSELSDLPDKKAWVILAYNSTKGGVDTLDQIDSNLQLSKRNKTLAFVPLKILLILLFLIVI